MRHLRILFLLFTVYGTILANEIDYDEIKTMLHVGHPVKSYAISFDEKYIFTRNDLEICCWDLRSRMLLKTIPIKCSSIYAHPIDSRLLYVKISKEKNIYFPADKDADFAIINWKDVSINGIVSSLNVSSKSAFSDFEIVRYANDMLILFPRVEGVKATGYIGGLNANIGSVRTNHNDSLLLTSGLLPQIWDLHHARIAGNIPYYKYLNPNSNGRFYEIKNNPYKKGGMPYVAKYCESYFIPGTDDIILGGVKDTVTIWHQNKDLRYSVKEEINVGVGASPSLSIYGNTIIAATKRGIYKSVDRKEFKELNIFADMAGKKEFTIVSRPYKDGKFLTAGIGGLKGMPSLFEGSFNEDKPLRVSDKRCDWINDIKISPKEDYSVITYGYKGIALVDLKKDTLYINNPLKSEWKEDENINRCEILPDETIVAGSNLGGIHFWKKGEESSYMQKYLHHGSINSINLSNDSTRMFTSDDAGQITIWDISTLEPIIYLYQIYGLQEPAYIMLTPDNYYKATPNAYEFVNFVKNGEAYSFEQFDLRNNRPDIILQRLGGDKEEIDLMYKAWKKRLRRAGISEESLSTDYHVPEVKIKNIESIPPVTSDNILTIETEFLDNLFELKEISVIINGVPVLDPDKRKVKGKNIKKSIAIELASGNNEIAVSCMNEKGSSSLQQIINIIYSPKVKQKPDLYVVAVGVSEYSDSSYNLGYAEKDARDFTDIMNNVADDKYNSVKKLLLTNGNFNGDSLEKIKNFIASSRRDDVILLFYAGHGVLDSNLDYFLASGNIDFNNPENGGIIYDDFINILDGAPSINRYCFIDACHSGELDKEDYIAMNTVSMPKGEELIFRGAGKSAITKDEVKKVKNILDNIFLDIRWGVGATILSSAGGDELAVESSDWKNGLFTYCLKKGLKNKEADLDSDGTVTLKELAIYTSNKVNELSEGRQSPTIRSHNYHNDFLQR